MCLFPQRNSMPVEGQVDQPRHGDLLPVGGALKKWILQFYVPRNQGEEERMSYEWKSTEYWVRVETNVFKFYWLDLQMEVPWLQMQMCVRAWPVTGAWVSPDCKPLGDYNALAVHQVWCGESSFTLWGLLDKAFAIIYGQAWKITHKFLDRSWTPQE